MKAVVAALLLLFAPPLAAGISSEMYLDAPAGRIILRFDVAFSTNAEVTLVAAARDPQGVVLAATQARRLVAWSRIDPDEGPVCLVCPSPVPTVWLATTIPEGVSVRQLTSWERGVAESAAATGEKLFLANSSLSASERFELLQLQPDRPERSSLFIGESPRIDADGERLVLVRSIRSESGLLLVISRLDANEVGAAPPLHSPGGMVMASDATGSSRLAAGRSAALVLHQRQYSSRLAYRIVEFGSGEALPPQPEAVTLGTIIPADRQEVLVSWRDPATITTPLRYRISYLVADDPHPWTRGGTVDRAGTAFLTGLEPDAPYILYIHSVSGVALSEPFRAEFRTPPFGVPRQADNVTITPRSDGTAIVAWRDRSSSEVGYRIYDVWRTLLAEVGANVSTATIRLRKGWHWYLVVPFNATGEGSPAWATAYGGRTRAVGR